MRILIITQDDPFFLADNLRFLISRLPSETELVGCIVFSVSPFGKQESFFDKIRRTYSIFGFGFMMNYGIRFLLNKFDKTKKVASVMTGFRVPLIKLSKGINTNESLQVVESYKPDLMISIAGNQIFKKRLLNIPTKGTINLHTALLPKYRGLMPTFWVLKNNEVETGVSVFMVDEGIDSGPILVQKKVPITNQSQRELIIQTKRIGMECILEAIEKIRDGRVEYIPNPVDHMSYYSFPTKNDVVEFRRIGKRFY